MLKFLDKLFWLAIYIIILAVLLLAGRFVAYWLDWPAWSSVAIAIVCVVFFFGARGCWRWWRRRREEKMAIKLLEADQDQEKQETSVDPELATRMSLTWKAGLSFLGNSRLGKIDFAYKLPWYIAIGDDDQERETLLDSIKVKGAEAKPTVANPEFSWLFARNAVWLDLPFGFKEDGDERWRLFAADLVRNRGKAPLGGVVVMGDAGNLLAAGEDAIKERAATIRSRLDTLIKATGARVPVYVLINGIDALYGMRALIGTLPSARLDQPFGAFRTDEKESPGAFAARLPREAAVALASASRREEIEKPLGMTPQRLPTLFAGQAAAFQAPDELPRLAEPLSLFCREAFSDNPYQMVPLLRGIFFGSSRVATRVIPSLLSRIPSFKPEVMEAASAHVHRPYFFGQLLDEWIPRDPAPNRVVRERRHMRAVSVYSGLAGLLCGTLVLCWLMTFSFIEARGVLDSVTPESLDHLAPDDPHLPDIDSPLGNNMIPPAAPLSDDASQDYHALFSPTRHDTDNIRADDLKTVNTLLDSAMQVELRNRQWHLPRFGMAEPLALQESLKDAFCGHFFSLVLKPALESVAHNAIAAAGGSNATDIGNSLIMLISLRTGLENRLAGKRPTDDIDYFFSIADVASQGASQSQARARLEMYLHWVDVEPWMREASDTFLSLERNLITDGAGGNVMAWLPAWVDGLSGVQAVDTSSVWAPVSIPSSQTPKRTVRGAWTQNGYQLAKRFLSGIVYDPKDDQIWEGRRNAILGQYRAQALAAWRDAVYELWRDYQANIDDADLPTLIKQVASGTGPTSRMNDLLVKNLLPLFDGDDSNPDIEWLRRNNQLLSSAGGLLKAAGAGEAGPSVLSKITGAVSDAVRKIGSDDNIALLSRNIGFSTGNEMMTALDNYGKLNRSFADVAFLTGSRDTCIDLVSSQYRRSGAPAATLSAAADATAGVNPAANGGGGDAPASDISKNPFGDGKIAADALNVYLTGVSGSSTWLGISPQATYNYLRYLAARQAAIHLDAKWLESVYNPTITSSGTEDEKMNALFDPGGSVNTFLNQTTAGLWRVSGNRLVNSVWDELPFMFNDHFLNFCAVGIANASVKYPEKVSINFRVESVSVDSGARERPNEITFIWQEGSENQELVYRNYVTSRVFDWKMDKEAVAAVIISFPSLTLVKEFTGHKALGKFVEQFNHGQTTFQASEFPGQAEALARLGVNRIVIRATMQNQAHLLKFMNVEVPTIPGNIITEPKKR